jgi:hypothetical protein
MEMRRQRPSTSSVAAGPDRGERLLITLYWLTSGYALRTSRALLSLALVIAVFAVLFHTIGFRDATRLVDAALFSAGTATAVIGAPSRPLTDWGELLRIVLRVVGPILIGLALLSIRRSVHGRILRVVISKHVLRLACDGRAA